MYSIDHRFVRLSKEAHHQRTLKRILLGLLVFSWFVFALARCGDALRPWTAQEESQFLSGCLRGSSAAYCQCALQEVEHQFSPEQVSQMTTSQALDIASQCR